MPTNDLTRTLRTAVLTRPAYDEPAPRQTLRPWTGIIDLMLAKDFAISAMRIFRKLRIDYAYPGCYTSVQMYVHEVRSGLSSVERRKLQTQEKHREAQKPQETPTLQEQTDVRAGTYVPLFNCRSSERTARGGEQNDVAFEWLQSLQQGGIPLEVLAKELCAVPLAELEILLSAATKGELSKRNMSLAMMGYLRGLPCNAICSFLHVSRGTIFRWLRLFRKGGATALFTRRPRSDIKASQDCIKQAVFSVLHSPPSSHGFNRTTWRMPDLRSVLSQQLGRPLSCDVIRKVIKEAGWKWRHARVVLTSNDPDYRIKVDAIKKILSELKADEAFFSIDEFGPFAVKKKGGVKRLPPGERYVVPQWQKSKGWLIVTAALELSRNQVSHFYSRKKNTDEMIRMAEHLRNQYRSCRTIYLSWDAASWHISKDLTAYLDRINADAVKIGFPIVKTAPLPACAQFLNVIESVFSGMAKAIIHNSDYHSGEEAGEAIDRYFRERNEHFLKHPSRAGRKIWGQERVASTFTEGQNCKDPMYKYI